MLLYQDIPCRAVFKFCLYKVCMQLLPQALSQSSYSVLGGIVENHISSRKKRYDHLSCHRRRSAFISIF